jgi:phosphoenolpyruvate carboxykinase (ATP)
MSGYTAKVAGTEAGVIEPKAVFSACFGAPFMPLHPSKYAERLKSKMHDQEINVWLINTGWSGGSYGVGSRIPLKYTRIMIENAINGSLENAKYVKDEIFGLSRIETISNIPESILDPKKSWKKPEEYDRICTNLAKKFNKNFEQFKSQSSKDIFLGGPILK